MVRIKMNQRKNSKGENHKRMTSLLILIGFDPHNSSFFKFIFIAAFLTYGDSFFVKHQFMAKLIHHVSRLFLVTTAPDPKMLLLPTTPD